MNQNVNKNFLNALNEMEGSKSSEEEEGTPLQILRMSTQQRRQPNSYNYGPPNFRYIVASSTKVDEPRTVKEAMEMQNKES